MLEGGAFADVVQHGVAEGGVAVDRLNTRSQLGVGGRFFGFSFERISTRKVKMDGEEVGLVGNGVQVDPAQQIEGVDLFFFDQVFGFPGVKTVWLGERIDIERVGSSLVGMGQ